MQEMKYSGLSSIGRTFCISGKVLPTTINIKPTPHERMINKLQVSTSCKVCNFEIFACHPDDKHEQNINSNVNQCLKQCTCNDRIDGFYWSIIKQSLVRFNSTNRTFANTTKDKKGIRPLSKNTGNEMSGIVRCIT